MSLIEDAKKAYENDKLANKEAEEKETSKFILDVKQTIKEKFGENLYIEITTDKEGEIVFIVDGLKMRARKSQGYYNIYLLQTCAKCGTEFEEHIINLKNIGKALENGHSSIDCNNILKNRESVKEWTTEEKLIAALRTFIHENSSEFI